MSYKEKFNAEDWSKLQNSFLWVFKAIAGVDGKIDRKEKNAMNIIIDNTGNFDSKLGNELLNDLKNMDGDAVAKAEQDTSDLKTSIKEVGEILDKKVDREEAVDFKKLLIAVGAYIGDSSGKWFDYKFSDEEEEKLKEIGRWLNTSTEAFLSTTILSRILKNVKE
jgi:tellurite resistance protein